MEKMGTVPGRDLTIHMSDEYLRDYLKESGFEVIRYEIPPERYAFQIYRNLGFTVESQDESAVRFIWRR
jgi:hypothetical protein